MVLVPVTTSVTSVALLRRPCTHPQMSGQGGAFKTRMHCIVRPLSDLSTYRIVRGGRCRVQDVGVNCHGSVGASNIVKPS